MTKKRFYPYNLLLIDIELPCFHTVIAFSHNQCPHALAAAGINDLILHIVYLSDLPLERVAIERSRSSYVNRKAFIFKSKFWQFLRNEF